MNFEKGMQLQSKQSENKTSGKVYIVMALQKKIVSIFGHLQRIS